MSFSSAGAAASARNRDADVRARLRRALRPAPGDFAIAVVPMVAIAGASAGLAWLGGPLLVALLGATPGSPLPRADTPAVDRTGMEHLMGSDAPPIGWLLAGLCALALLRGLAQFAQAAATERLQQGAMARIRRILFERLLAAEPMGLVRVSPSEVAARIASDVQRFDALVGNGALSALTHGLTLTAIAGFALSTDAVIAGLALATLPPLGVLGYWLSKRARTTTEAALEAHATLARAVGETAEGIATVQTANAGVWARDRLMRHAAQAQRKMMRAATARALLGPAMGFSASIAFALMLVVARDRLDHGLLTMADSGSLLAALFLMVRPMTALGSLAGTIASGLAALDRVEDLLVRLPEGENSPVVFADPGAPRPASERTPFEALTVDGLTYRGGERAILDGVRFSLGRGEIVAIVGANGAGKTTLLKVLLGHATATAGRVLVNGQPLRRTPEARDGDLFAWVPDQATFFTGSIRENLCFSEGPADDARLHEALRLSGADAVVARLPGGLEALLHHAGRELSLGERQRLALARALYETAPVLVLDEPTAHLDPLAADALTTTIEGLLRDRTVLLVSHRWSTVRRAHRAVLLEGGHVTAEGSPDALMADCGPFRELFVTREPQPA